MKILPIGMAAILSLAVLAGCTTADTARRDDREHPSVGEAAGKAAYDIKKGAQKAAKEISKDLKNFDRDAKAGYQQEKSKDANRPHGEAQH
jgi:hypothetical protein